MRAVCVFFFCIPALRFFVFSGDLRCLCFFCIFVAFCLHFLCVCFAFLLRFVCVVFAFVLNFRCVFFAFSLRFLCVWGARGSERLWDGWKCKNPGGVACFLHFLCMFLHFRCLCLHFLCAAFAFSLSCCLIFFASVARSLCRCTAAAQVLGLFQKQRQPQNANKRDTRTPKKSQKCKPRTQKQCKTNASRMQNDHFKDR